MLIQKSDQSLGPFPTEFSSGQLVAWPGSHRGPEGPSSPSGAMAAVGRGCPTFHLSRSCVLSTSFDVNICFGTSDTDQDIGQQFQQSFLSSVEASQVLLKS